MPSRSGGDLGGRVGVGRACRPAGRGRRRERRRGSGSRPLLNAGRRVAKGAAASAAPMTLVVSRSSGPTSPRPSPATRTRAQQRAARQVGVGDDDPSRAGRAHRAPPARARHRARPPRAPRVLRTAEAGRPVHAATNGPSAVEQRLGQRVRRARGGEPERRRPERAAVVAVEAHPEGRGQGPADRHRGDPVAQRHLGPAAADPAVAARTRPAVSTTPRARSAGRAAAPRRHRPRRRPRPRRRAARRRRRNVTRSRTRLDRR